jgi:hypothetical protein
VKIVEDLKPRPDPTALTTEQLKASILSLRELIEARLTTMDTKIDALKEAVLKSEGFATKSIDQQTLSFNTTTGALNGKIEDLKERVTLVEGRDGGHAQGWAAAIAIFGLLLALFGLAVALRR